MILRFIKPGYRVLLTALAILTIVVVSFLIWIISAPRSVPYLADRIEITLSSLSPDFEVQVGDTVLKWEGLESGLSFHLTDTLVLHKGKVIGAFPDMRVRLSLIHLLLGSIVLNDLIVAGPEFNVSWDLKGPEIDDKSIGPPPVSVYQKAIVDILSAIEQNNKKIPLRNVQMHETKLVMHNGKEDILWEIPEMSISFFLADDAVTFRSTIFARLEGDEVTLHSEGFLEDKQWLRVQSFYTGVKPSLVGALIPELHWLSKLTSSYEGSLDALLNPKGYLDSVEFDFSTTRQETADEMPWFKALGSIDFDNQVGDQTRVPEIHVNTVVTEMKTELLKDFWPEDFAPITRDWVTSNITNGTYPRMAAEFHFTPEDIVGKTLPKDSIKAIIELSGADVAYYPDLPPLTNTSAIAKFDAQTSDIRVHHGTFMKSFISNGRIFINNLHSEDVSIAIEGDIKGNASDLLTFSQVQISDTDTQPAYANYDIKGNAKTHFKIDFPLYGAVATDSIDVQATADFNNITIPEVLPGIDLAGGNFRAAYDSSFITIAGEGILNGIGSELSLESDFSGAGVFDTRYTFKTVASPVELQKLGITNLDVLHGSLDIDIQMDEKQGEQHIIGKLNGREASTAIEFLGWNKPYDMPLTLSFSAKTTDGKPIEVKTFSLEAEDLQMDGQALLSKDEKGSHRVEINNFVYGNNDFEMELIAHANDLYSFTINGKSLDISAFFAGDDERETSTAFNAFIDIDRLILANEVVIEEVVSRLGCNAENCTSVNLSGRFVTGGSITLNYDSVKEGFQLSSEDAGALLRGINIHDKLDGGVIEASAISNEDGTGLENGKLILKDLRIIKAPILAKVLTLASLTGILDLLNGEGIYFEKLKGEFAYRDKVFLLSGVKASGNALGITLNGTVDTKQRDLDLQGAIIPAYALNSFLGSVPLVGDILIGNEGEGLIATCYNVEGNIDDPEIAVNPLSMLTPGILRKIWEGEEVTLEQPSAN